jgi:DNA modification methylase
MPLPTPYFQTPDGAITLYHGDCREVMEDLGPGICDMVFTDPPYGHNNNNGDLIHRREEALGKGKVTQKDARPIANDGPEATPIFAASLPLMYSALNKVGCCCCCCGGGGPDPMFARWSLLMDAVFSFKQQVVWDKGPMGMGWHYRRSYETILVGQKGKPCKWHDDSHRIENIIRPGQYGIRKIIPSKNEHPTPKPVALPQLFIGLHTLPGETVLDPFMGRAPTGVAAMRTGRRYIGIEIEEHWCEQSALRLQQEAPA